MHIPLAPSSMTPNRGLRIPLSVGPLYEREAGRVVRVGMLTIADDLAAPRPSWELLQELTVRAERLRATFTLASRPLPPRGARPHMLRAGILSLVPPLEIP